MFSFGFTYCFITTVYLQILKKNSLIAFKNWILLIEGTRISFFLFRYQLYFFKLNIQVDEHFYFIELLDIPALIKAIISQLVEEE